MNKIKNLVLIFLFSIICAAMIGFVACSAGAAGEKGETGDTGAQGSQGIKGESGEDGEDALTTYEIYLQYYPDYTGTEEEFYAAIADGSLVVHTVTADYGGTTEVITVKFGDKISQPETEDMFGYTYAWMCGDEAWNFTGYTVTEDITLTLTYSLITSGLQFTLNAEETACTVSGYTGSDTEIIIPETYNNVAVTEIGESVFSGSTATSITIPATVTTFGSEAFSGGSIENVYYLGTAQEWAQLSFSTGTANPLRYGAALYTTEDNSGYTLLTELTLNATPAKYAFAGCSSITSVTFGTGATSTGYSAFSNSSSLKKVEIGGDVTTVYTASFQNCTALETVDLGKVTTLSQQSFMGCTALKEITIPDSVATIPQQCFSGCTALTTLTISAGVTSIGSSAFYGTTALTTIYYNTDLITGLTTTSKPFDGAGSSSGLSFIIGDSVTTVPDYLLYYHTKVTSLTIGSGVTSLGSNAFYGTTALTTIYYNTDLITGLSSTSKPFDNAGSSNGLSVVFGSNVTATPDYLFYYKTKLTSITIPTNLVKFGYQSFYECTSLTTVNYDGTASQWAAISFRATTNNPTYYSRSLYLSDGNGGYELATEITIDNVTPNSYAFYRVKSIRKLTIGSGVTDISTSSTFFGCTALTEIYNLSSLEITAGNSGYGYVAYYALVVYTDASATGGTYFTQDGFTFYILDSTYYLIGYDYTLTDFVLPTLKDSSNNVIKYQIKDRAFYQDKNITSIVIPDSVTSLGAYTFYYCSALASVTLGNGITEIGDNTFNQCTSLTTITIPEGVKTLGRYAFGNCTSLTTIVIPTTVTTLGSFAFNYIENPLTIYFYGTEAQYNVSSAGAGTAYTEGTIYYYSATQPTESGNYWYYDSSNNIVVWPAA